MRDRIKRAALLLLSISAFIYIVGLNQQKWGEDHDLNEESAKQERKTEQLAENMKQEEFFDDYSWYYEIYADAVALAEEKGFYQFLNLGKTWISEEGHYCAFFIAEYSDSGVWLDAQSMDVYELTFQDSIYTENFAGMDYRTIEVNERKVAETEKILLQNGINERCRLCDLVELHDLKFIMLAGTDVEDVKALRNLENLTDLHIYGNKNIEVKEQAEMYMKHVESVVVEEGIPSNI